MSGAAPRIVLPREPLIDGRTALRAWRDEDAPALAVACQDAEIARWTRVPSPYTLDDARAYVQLRHETPAAGSGAPFAIVDADDPDRVLGSISLMRFAWGHARGEVGYWLAAGARGAGHATRAVSLICDWGFRNLRLERIDLMAATGNVASQRVAERAGFAREAVLRSYLAGPGGRGGRDDVVMFARLAGA